MSILRVIVPALLFAFAPTYVLAQNPNASMSIIGDNTVRVAPGAHVDQLFSVRVVDTAGAPMAGISVGFAPNFCIYSDVNACPPAATYGTFANPSTVVTDANGVAAAPPFTAGSIVGVYDAVAIVSPYGSPANEAIGRPSFFSFLHVQQVALPSSMVPITSAFTGAWYDPAQSGHGILVEVLSENRFLAYWFSFTADGSSQAWFGGVGTIYNDIAIVSAETAIGGRWIPNFDPLALRPRLWGTLIVHFDDCNHGRVDFGSVIEVPGGPFGDGHMDLYRLTQPAGLSCP